MTIEAAKNSKTSVIELLRKENLPVDDLPEFLDNFLLARENGALIGVVGLELYGEYTLLRSMAVARAFRGNGIASDLIVSIESLARTNKVKTVYLLTETASGYFKKKGYLQIGRDEVPAEVQSSSEFSHVCPVSAIVMSKNLAS